MAIILHDLSSLPAYIAVQEYFKIVVSRLQCSSSSSSTQAILQFSVSVMCIETYTKIPLSADLRKLVFLTES